MNLEKLARLFPPSGVIAIEPHAVPALAARLSQGVKVRSAAYRARGGTAAGYELRGDVACVPIRGAIVHGEEGDDAEYGLCSVNSVVRMTQAAMADSAVRSIAFMIDSPGGTVRGLRQAASALRQARSVKPTAAYVGNEGMMCSAAYNLGCSGASKIYCGEDAMVGSIGVFSTHYDTSENAKMNGVKVVVVKSGEMKGAGVPGTPITPEQITELEKLVAHFYGAFIDAVSQGRGITNGAALALGDGRVHLGAASVEAGLADQVLSEEEFWEKVGASAPAPITPRAVANERKPKALSPYAIEKAAQVKEEEAAAALAEEHARILAAMPKPAPRIETYEDRQEALRKAAGAFALAIDERMKKTGESRVQASLAVSRLRPELQEAACPSPR